MIAVSQVTETEQVETSDADDDLELDLPTIPNDRSFLVLQGRYEALCEAAGRQLHELLRADPRAS